MKILAIETSCDETAIAIAEFLGTKKNPRVSVFSNIVSSQVKLHAKYGGVVPNLAKREHQKNLPAVLIKSLKEGRFLNDKFQITNSKQIQNSKLKILNKILEREQELLTQFKKSILPLPVPDIDAIAVTIGPGLAPALWVGVNFARALAVLWDKPIIPVNHMAGHIYSALLQKSGIENSKSQIQNIKFPAMALLVSGGHTELVLIKKGLRKSASSPRTSAFTYKTIGETLDDAAGEAFDKVARLLKLGYPGGPEIARLAAKGNPKKYLLPRPMFNSKDYNFSFSGLKTALLYLIRDLCQAKPGTRLSTKQKNDIAASFQEAVLDVLIVKTIRAAKEYRVRTALLGGGVAANAFLRQRLSHAITANLPSVFCLMPHISLTGDNALMIALAAFFTPTPKILVWGCAGKPAQWKKIEADANLRLSKV